MLDEHFVGKAKGDTDLPKDRFDESIERRVRPLWFCERGFLSR
jgi:hypothetical protein